MRQHLRRTEAQGRERAGRRGRHHYYTVRAGVGVAQRNGQIGPRESFIWISDPDDPRKESWKYPINLKSSLSYVCATGTLPKSGPVYTALAPITRETNLSLPEFDDGLYVGLARTCKPLRPDVAMGKVTTSSATSKTGQSVGTYDRGQQAGSARLPGPGLLAGKTQDEAAALLGLDARVECACPFHQLVSSRSATLRVLQNGTWRLSCHVEDVTYEPEVHRRPIVEEIDATEDELLPLTVGIVAARLLRDGTYEAAQELIGEEAFVSDELYATFTQASDGIAGENAEEARQAELEAAYEAKP